MQRDEAAGGERPLFHVLPRGMMFSRDGASSIDLFVSEVAAHSRFQIEIVAEFREPALPATKLHPLPRYPIAETYLRARRVAALARAQDPGLIVVQQHLPSAAAIGRRVAQPILLQRHNFLRPPRAGLWGGLARARHARQLGALAGITFVSEAARADFERDWPEVATPRWVVPNGVDCASWRPSAEREPLVLVVGRATPEKGLLEAAQALAATLPDHPGWGAAFVVSGARRGADYLDRVRAALAPLSSRAQVLVEIPYAQVKALNEQVAISLIPSKWREPFGRTCLEALAGGAAVVTSGSGGLREIGGEAAIYVPDAEPARLAGALEALICDAALRQRLACEGRARAETLFDLPGVARRLDDVCQAILARAK